MPGVRRLKQLGLPGLLYLWGRLLTCRLRTTKEHAERERPQVECFCDLASEVPLFVLYSISKAVA